jgi:hypothetical protein
VFYDRSGGLRQGARTRRPRHAVSQIIEEMHADGTLRAVDEWYGGISPTDVTVTRASRVRWGRVGAGDPALALRPASLGRHDAGGLQVPFKRRWQSSVLIGVVLAFCSRIDFDAWMRVGDIISSASLTS